MAHSVGFWVEHPLDVILHSEPTAQVKHNCPSCNKLFEGNVREVLDNYREHVLDGHFEELEDCGCCGCFHFPEFNGDCREDFERF